MGQATSPFRRHSCPPGALAPAGPPNSVPWDVAGGRRGFRGWGGSRAPLRGRPRSPHTFPCGALETGPPTRLPRARACECACPRPSEASWGFVPQMDQEDRNVSLGSTFFQHRFREQKRWRTAQGLSIFFALLDAGGTECGPDSPAGLGQGLHPFLPHDAPSALPTPLPSLNPKLSGSGEAAGGGAGVYFVVAPWGAGEEQTLLREGTPASQQAWWQVAGPPKPTGC